MAAKRGSHSGGDLFVRNAFLKEGVPCDAVDRLGRRIPIGPFGGRSDQVGFRLVVFADPGHFDGIAVLAER